jgi:hypothetical protein
MARIERDEHGIPVGVRGGNLLEAPEHIESDSAKRHNARVRKRERAR